jgi:TP901 family phage tail tape measure protein
VADFLINVRSQWDTASVRAYAEEVNRAIQRIKQTAATAAAGGPVARASLGPQVLGEQARMEAGLTSLRQSGALSQAEYANVARSLREAMAAAAQAAGVELRSGQDRQRAANQVLAANRAAAAAEVGAAEARTREAQRSTRASARAAAATGTRTPPLAPGEATYQRTLVNQQARQRAQAQFHGIDYVEGEQPGVTRERARQADRLAALDASARNLRQVASREGEIAALAHEEARLRALVNRDLNATERAARRQALQQEAIAAGARPGGTLYQRAVSYTRRRAGDEDVVPETVPTGRQALASSALVAGRYAVSGALLYGAFNTIKEMVQTANELELTFNQIEAQFAATDSAAEFPRFRQALFDISRETGESVQNVAFVGYQLRGAFGDTEEAITSTTAAIRIARVTGLELNEVVDSLTAASRSFGVSIEEVGDVSLGLQDRFGVLARESIKVFGDLGPSAAAAGLSIRELGAIIGPIQQASGRGGAAIAEGLGRILPSIQGNARAILDLYSSIPNLAPELPDIGAALGEGRVGDVLLSLIRNFRNLTKTQQDYVVELIGGRREAQLIIPAFENADKVVAELGRTQGDSGLLAERFAAAQETLRQRMDRLRATFVQFGQQLFDAGIGDLLKDILGVSAQLLTVALALARVFADLNDATGGWALKVVELYAGLRLLRGASGVLGNVFGSLRGRAAGAARGGLYDELLTPASRAALTQAGVNTVGSGLLAGARQRAAAEYAAARTMPRVGGGFSPIAAGASGALAATGLTPAGMGIIAGGAVIAARQSQSGRVKAAQQAFEQRVRQMDEEQLQQIAQDKAGFFERIQFSIFGSRSPDEIAREEQQKRRYNVAPGGGGISLRDQIRGARKAGLIDDTDKRINDVLADAEKGNKDAIDRIQRVIDALNAGDPETRAKLSGAIAEVRNQDAVKAATQEVDTGQVARSVEEAQRLYQAGAITITEYIARLRKGITDANNAVNVLGRETSEGKAAADQAAQWSQDLAKLQSDAARQLVDFNLQQAELAGGGGPQARVEALTNLLRSGQLVTPESQQKAAEDIVNAQKQVVEDQAALADDAIAAYEIIKAGAVVPEEARVVILETALNQTATALGDFMTQVAAVAGGILGSTHDLAVEAVQRGVGVVVIIREKIRTQMAALRALAVGPDGLFGSDQADINQEYNRLETLLGKLDAVDAPVTPGGTTRPDAQRQAAARKAASAEAQRRADEAAREREETNRARFNLLRAEAAGDPVRTAQIDLEEANQLRANARTTAEALNAQAQVVQAQRALAEAQLQVGDAYRNIDRALAEAAGDTVRVAEIELDQARAHLESARARGDLLGGLQAEADLIAAQANVVRAQIDKGTQDIDFMLQMEQITTAQAIAQLEALLQVPGITQEQTRNLLLKIRQLRADASADVAFNIPSEIRLPTLYEVRRANQTAAMGQSYQDARVITINFTANNTADAQGIANEIVDRFSGPSRFGALPRRY